MKRTTLVPLTLLLLAGCGGKKPVDPTAPPPPAQAVVPMQLSAQNVLVLPAQGLAGVAQSQAEVTSELLFALAERDATPTWIGPDRLRAALRRSPGYAPDPGVLPPDDYLHHHDRYIVDPLASLVRRYSALMDARLVLIPRSAVFHALPDGSGGRVRLDAAVVDARSGRVLWFGQADGAVRPSGDREAVATAAAVLAARMVSPPGS